MDITTLNKLEESNAIVLISNTYGKIVREYNVDDHFTRYCIVHNNPKFIGYSVANKHGFDYSYCIFSDIYGDTPYSASLTVVDSFNPHQLVEFIDANNERKYGVIRSFDEHGLYIDTGSTSFCVPLHCVKDFYVKYVDSTPIHLNSIIHTTGSTVTFMEDAVLPRIFVPDTKLIVKNIKPFDSQGVIKLYCTDGVSHGQYGVYFGKSPSDIVVDESCEHLFNNTPTFTDRGLYKIDCDTRDICVPPMRILPICAEDYLGSSDSSCKNEECKAEVSNFTTMQKIINKFKKHKPVVKKLDLPDRKETILGSEQKLQLLVEQKLTL